jgi:hypothetical protein
MVVTFCGKIQHGRTLSVLCCATDGEAGLAVEHQGEEDSTVAFSLITFGPLTGLLE